MRLLRHLFDNNSAWAAEITRQDPEFVKALSSQHTEAEQHDRLCELNVVEQVVNVAQTTVVRDAWSRNQPVAVHGWVCGLRDGLLRDLRIVITSAEELPVKAKAAREGALA